MIYLASPMASTKDKKSFSYSQNKFKRNKQIANKLKKAGFDIFLPQENQLTTPEESFKNELEIINKSEFIIALLSNTRGVYLEVGYAKGIGKKIYAIELSENRKMSPWSKCWYDYIAKDVTELIAYLKD